MSSVKEVTDGIKGMLDAAKSLRERKAVSLTEYGKESLIMTRGYIQSSLVNEDFMLPTLKTLNQLVCGFVLTALNMQQMVSKARSVRDLTKLVSTERYVDAVELVNNDFGDGPLEGSFEMTQRVVRATEAFAKYSDIEPRERSLLAGTVLEITLANEEGGNVTIIVAVQIVPTIITKEAGEGFITLNFHPSLKRRWKQVLAGQKSFGDDLVLGRDLIEGRKKALKNDPDGILTDMLRHQNNSMSKAMASASGITAENHNSANCVLIMNKRDFQRAALQHSVDFEKNASQRAAFFAKSMLMMVVLIDVDSGLINVYYHGINTPGIYTTDMMVKAAKSDSGKFELKDVITVMAGGRPPRA